MFELILKQMRAIIKQSDTELETKILQELRSTEALLRADIAMLLWQISKQNPQTKFAKVLVNQDLKVLRVSAKTLR